MIRVNGGGGGGLPSGVTGDGLTPGGLAIEGDIAAQTGTGGVVFQVSKPTTTGGGSITAGDPAALDATPSAHTLNGVVLIQDSLDANSPVLEVDQTANRVHVNHNQALLRLFRASTSGPSVTRPIISAENDDGASIADFINYIGGSGGQGFRVGVAGGVGMFTHAPMTAPRTLAQATITAITDANAKAAVQACANALSDMGALTLT